MTLRFQFLDGSVRDSSRARTLGPLVCVTDVTVSIVLLLEHSSVIKIILLLFLGPHFRLLRFDSPLTTPSEVKINGRHILPVI